MIFAEKEVADGLVRLGFQADAKYLRQRLMEVLLRTSHAGLSDGAVRAQEGARSFAAELIEALGFNREGIDGGRTDSGLVRRTRTGTDAGSGRSTGIARRVPPADD